jgi:hypothetical protein
LSRLFQIGPSILPAAGGTITATLEFHYPTRMAVIQLPNQDLVIWPHIALEPNLQREVSAPAFPDTHLYGAPNLDTKRPDIRFSATLGNTPEPAWNKAIDQVIFETALTTEVILFHRESGIVLFTDLLQQLPKSWFRGWQRVIARLDLMLEEQPTVPRKFRLATRNRAAARISIDRILSWPVQGVVIAHGTPVRENCNAYLQAAFKWLQP